MTSESTPANIARFIGNINKNDISKTPTVSLGKSHLDITYNYKNNTANSNIGSVTAKFEIINKKQYDEFSVLMQKLSENNNNKNKDNKVNINPNHIGMLLGKIGIDAMLNDMDKISNIRCIGKVFRDNNNVAIFTENFCYKNKQKPKENERRISLLSDIDKKTIIGFTYYENCNVFGNSLITVNDGQEISPIYYGITEQNPPTFISDSIIRKLYINKPGTLIGGKSGLSYDYLAILNKICKTKRNNKCHILPISILDDNNPDNILNSIQDDKTLIKTLKLSDKIGNKAIALLPVGTDKHVSTIIIDLNNIPKNDLEKDKKFCYSFDSSLVHRNLINHDKLDESIFGNYLVNHTEPLINSEDLQFNGTCTYWTDAFCEVVVTSSEYNGSNGLGNIKRDCENGTMFLKCAERLGRIFDEDKKPATVMIYGENQAIDNDNYYNFKINEKDYGISKTSGLNKFVNLETLIETLEIEPTKKEELRTALKNQIEGQKKIEEKEREIFNFKQLEKIEKAYKNKIKKIENTISSSSDTKTKQLLGEELNSIKVEQSKFYYQFNICKLTYNSIEDREIKYEALKHFVELNQDLNETKIIDYIQSSDLNNQLKISIEKIKNFNLIKNNQSLFNFRSKVKNTEIILDTEEVIPNIPNTQITSSLSSITATNIKNPANFKPPTSPDNPNNNVTEKTMF